MLELTEPLTKTGKGTPAYAKIMLEKPERLPLSPAPEAEKPEAGRQPGFWSRSPMVLSAALLALLPLALLFLVFLPVVTIALLFFLPALLPFILWFGGIFIGGDA